MNIALFFFGALFTYGCGDFLQHSDFKNAAMSALLAIVLFMFFSASMIIDAIKKKR
jgi:hypothetical protein